MLLFLHFNMLKYAVQGLEIALELGSHISSRGDGNELDPAFRILYVIPFNDPFNVLSNGFRKAGGGNTNHIGVIHPAKVINSFYKVIFSAINRSFLGQRRRCNIHGLVIMGGHMPPDIGTAALGAMKQGHAPGNPVKGMDASHGHTHFTGVNGQIFQLWTHAITSHTARPGC